MFTRPTFWENEVCGKVLRQPAISVESESAIRPRVRVRLSTGRPTMSPTARNMPVDSTSVTIMTMHIAATAVRWKVGQPKWNGVTRAMSGRSASPSRRNRPSGQARHRPAARPISTATLATKPVAKRLTTRITASTKAATPRWTGAPKSAAPKPPPAQLIPTGSSVTPMIRMTVPVTSGGKKLASLEKNGRSSRPNTPAPMVAPKMPGRPIIGSCAIATIGPTAAKLTPMMTGRRMPKIPRPRDWIRIAMPVTSRSQLIR